MPLDATVLAAEVALAIKSAVGPLAERLAAAEVRLSVLGDVRDRLITMETKAAIPMPAVQFIPGPAGEKGQDGKDGLPGKDGRDGIDGKAGEKGVDGLSGAPGPQGEPGSRGGSGPTGERGEKGVDGLQGKDGMDGLGWDDLSVAQVDDRTIVVKCLRGLQVKELGTLVFPVEIYRGVYVDGKTYDRGDGVTWAGSEWHCNETTATKPGDGSKAWTLKVKRGRDGKDGMNAIGSPSIPVVAVGKPYR